MTRDTSNRPLSATFELIVGKGGVGKSTLAAALATRHALDGSRTLAVELGAPAGLGRALGVRPVAAGVPTEVSPGLWYAWIDGENALAEYLALILPVRRLLAAVLDSRVYKYFVAAAPGLKELMTIGKLWYEHERELDSAKVWDRMVVDAGASGHSLQYLRMPDVAAKTFSSGLVHRETSKILELLRDPDRTAVHVVATPESMPLVEAAEIVAKLRGELALPLGTVFVNRCKPSPPDGAAEALDDLERRASEELTDAIASGRRALGWYAVQEEAIAEFTSDTGVRVHRLPAIVTDEFGPAEIRMLADRLTSDRAGGEG